MHNFILLLIKLGRTKPKWTIDEISQLKSHMKHLALCVTVIIMLVLPFGLLLLPLYIELADRREKSKINAQSYNRIMHTVVLIQDWIGYQLSDGFVGMHRR
jgi:hypothetical protein